MKHNKHLLIDYIQPSGFKVPFTLDRYYVEQVINELQISVTICGVYFYFNHQDDRNAVNELANELYTLDKEAELLAEQGLRA